MDREKERLEEEQALQLEDIEEENRRKLAEAKFTELELTDDLSQATDELRETLSQNSKHSKQTLSQRVSDWINKVNEPDNVSNQPQTSSMEFDNVAGLSNPAVIPALTDVVQIRQATPLVRSFANVNIEQRQSQIPPIGISSNSTILRPNSTPPPLAAVNTLPYFQPRPVNTTSNTVSTMTVPMINPQSRTLLPHVEPSVTQVNISTSHVIPNLSAWSFPAPNSFPLVYAAVPQPVQGEVTSTSTTAAPEVTNTGVFTPVVPIQSGGTTFYCNLLATTIPVTTSSMSPCTTAPVSGPFPTFPTTAQSTVHLTTPTAVTVQDIAQLLTAAKKDHLPEWELEQYNEDPLQWHEWIGQFRSAIDAAALSNDVKLTYLKTLVTGKAKIAIAEFAYCGTMYQEALKTLERKFGQPHAVVSAHLDKLSGFPPLKMHNSENVIAFSATISALVGVLRSLKYDHDLSSAALLSQAVQKHEGSLVYAHC